MADKEKKSKGKIRKKVIHTPNGLQVVWVDIATGKQVSDPTGYTIVDSGTPSTSSSATSTSSLDDELNNILGIDTNKPNDGTSKPTTKDNSAPYKENLSDVPKNTSTMGGGGLAGLFKAAQDIGLFSTEPGEDDGVVTKWIKEQINAAGEDDGENEQTSPTPINPNSTNVIDTTLQPTTGPQTTQWGDQYGGGNVSEPVLGVIQKAQGLVGFSIKVISGYRDPEHNKKVGGAKASQHMHGNAVDIDLTGLNEGQRTELTRALVQAGALRLGAYSGDTSIHLDMAPGYEQRHDGYSAYPMFDKSINNMGKAPNWFRAGFDGTRVLGPAPTPAPSRGITVPDIPVQYASAEDPKGNTGSYLNAPNPELGGIMDGFKTAVLEDPKLNTGNAANFADRVPRSDLYEPGVHKLVTQGVEQAGTAQMPAPDAYDNSQPDWFTDINPHRDQAWVDRGPFSADPPPVNIAEQPKTNTGNYLNAPTQAPATPATTMGTGYTGVRADPIVNSYLNLVNKQEGSPNYNEAFNYVPFNDYSKHPEIYYKGGKINTSAAGRYQINLPTYNEFAPKAGVSDFTPDSQDAIAWTIAKENYKNKTGGGDLYEALKSNDPVTIATAFTKNRNRWVSLPGNYQSAQSLVEEFTASTQPKPVVAPTPMPYRPASNTKTDTYYGLPTNSDGTIQVQNNSFSTATPFSPKPLVSNSAPASEGNVTTSSKSTGFASRSSNSNVSSAGTPIGAGTSDYNPSAAGWSTTPRQLSPTGTGGATGGSNAAGNGFASKPATGGVGGAAKVGGSATSFSSKPSMTKEDINKYTSM